MENISVILKIIFYYRKDIWLENKHSHVSHNRFVRKYLFQNICYKNIFSTFAVSPGGITAIVLFILLVLVIASGTTLHLLGILKLDKSSRKGEDVDVCRRM